MLSLDAILPTQIFFDSAVKRYRWKDTRRFVSRESVLVLQRKYLAEQQKKFVSLATNIKNCKLGVSVELADALKRIHVSHAILSVGGVDRLTESDLGQIGSLLKKQYYQGRDEVTGKQFGLKYLIQEAPGQSLAQVTHRLELYAKAGRFTADTLQLKREAMSGKTQMKRLLGQAEHCEECIRYANQDWVGIGQLPLPGQQCSCRANCLCTLVFR
ncbi:MAG: hypothetical protein KME30_17170 [Iphinoe sp. HA4291-MV1]|jgi:hypothetical protein|nr:hypothetical protein [Iphinoe sp. HA4291-MV1]